MYGERVKSCLRIFIYMLLT